MERASVGAARAAAFSMAARTCRHLQLGLSRRGEAGRMTHPTFGSRRIVDPPTLIRSFGVLADEQGVLEREGKLWLAFDRCFIE